MYLLQVEEAQPRPRELIGQAADGERVVIERGDGAAVVFINRDDGKERRRGEGISPRLSFFVG